MAAAEKVRGVNRIKVLPFELDSVDSQERTIRGWASTSDVDRDGERINPDAFSRTLNVYERNPVLLLNHDQTKPIGKVVKVEIREKGLWIEARISDKTEAARETWGLIEDGILTTFSVRFMGIKGVWMKGEEVWEWTDVELWEVSVVTIPANPAAIFELAKSLGWEIQPLEAFIGTTEEREQQRCLDDCRRAQNGAESVANIARAWEKAGGAPSAAVVSACCEAVSSMAHSTNRVTKAGRVLSAAHRDCIEFALGELREVLNRDDASRATDGSDGNKAARGYRLGIGHGQEQARRFRLAR